MKASLIIPFYKDLEALEIILLALNRQSAKNQFEVIIAEDDDAAATKTFLSRTRTALHYPLFHSTQPDEGYQRSKALNNGIRMANNELIIFTDGDCIPHRHFIKAYLHRAAPQYLLYGRRVNLGPQYSQKVRTQKKLDPLQWHKLIWSDSNRTAEGLYLPWYPQALKSKRQPWGCNMGILKENLLAINGFDEDYREWGPEDLDLYSRLIQSGCSSYSLKYEAIIYHLYHTSKGLPEVVQRGQELYQRKMEAGIIFCMNGLIKQP
ncbi:MAG TPA: glycosyltransferase [Ferruginibacter sp.]|nr:glycosyltransferase [Ferruginibacter sp.]HMP19348.1 glycosyltransferase [Ferruginibacter sp.]